MNGAMAFTRSRTAPQVEVQPAPYCRTHGESEDVCGISRVDKGSAAKKQMSQTRPCNFETPNSHKTAHLIRHAKFRFQTRVGDGLRR